MDAGCCSIHCQSPKQREAIQHIAGNPNYDADLEHHRVLNVSRNDSRSVASISIHYALWFSCGLMFAVFVDKQSSAKVSSVKI